MSTQTQIVRSKVVVAPTPAVVVFYNFNFRIGKKEDEKQGHLIRLQPNYTFSGRNTYAPNIKIHEELLELAKQNKPFKAIVAVYREQRKWYSLEKREPCEGCDRVIIKIYKPKVEPKKPKIIAFFGAFEGAETGRGAYRDVKVEKTGGELFFATSGSTSRSGNHWETFIYYIGKPPLLLYRIRVSNRGRDNSYYILCDLEGCRTIDEFQPQQILKEWGWGRIYRDVFGRTILELEYHEAWKTCASTTHEISGNYELLKCESAIGRTHSRCWYLVKGPIAVKTIRITNSCKENTIEVTYP